MSEKEKIELYIAQIDTLINCKVACTSDDFEKWKINVERLLANKYGQTSYEFQRFSEISFNLDMTTFFAYKTDSDIDDMEKMELKAIDDCRTGLIQAKKLLVTYLADFEDKGLSVKDMQTDFTKTPIDYNQVDNRQQQDNKTNLYTERHNMRIPVEKTYAVSIKAYSMLFNCCERYFDNLAWKYPEECPDGNACCGLDRIKFNEDLEYEIPTLFRCDGIIDKPKIHKNIFVDGLREDKYDQYALFDLIEYTARNLRDIVRKSEHSYFGHYHFLFGSANTVSQKFVSEINSIFTKTGLLYCLTDNFEIERVEDKSVLSAEIEQRIDCIKETGLRELLHTAIQKHKSPYPEDQKDAVEKIWDALERLKTYYTTLDKKDSAAKIVNDIAGENTSLIELLNAEFKALTDIGNNYRIRHHETSKVDITDPRHYDYFFNRCLSLIALAIQYLK